MAITGQSCVLLLALLAAASTSSLVQGRKLPPELTRQRTTTNEEDLAQAEAEAAAAAAAAEDVLTAPSASSVLQLQDDPTAAVSDPQGGPPVASAAVSPCSSTQFEWPAGSSYCWYRRDSGGATAGPGGNVFKAGNVAVNAQDQLVLTVANPNKKIRTSSCGEVLASKSYGYGDYIFVVDTNPATVDGRLVGAPFVYANDTAEFDFEFSNWNTAGAQNSQYVVQPYSTAGNRQRFDINARNTTHRMRWTSSSVVFESFYPEGVSGGGRISSFTYTGPYNFVPGPELVHINFWINSRVNAVPVSSTYVTNCFKFCAAADLATCSTALGTKPRCSATKQW